jgi:hypothetical protein
VHPMPRRSLRCDSRASVGIVLRPLPPRLPLPFRLHQLAGKPMPAGYPLSERFDCASTADCRKVSGPGACGDTLSARVPLSIRQAVCLPPGILPR